MAVFFIFLFMLGIAATIITQSLIQTRWRRWVVPLLLFLLPTAFLPFLVRTGTETLHALAANAIVVQWLSLLMISEGLLTVWMGLARVVAHYDNGSQRKRTSLFFLPSWACLAAAPAISLYGMNMTTSLNFLTIALLAGGGFALFLACAQSVVMLIVKDWGRRFELRMTVALVQIIGAAFIPLVMQPVSFTGEAASMSWKTIGLFVGVSTVCIAMGFFVTTFFSIWRRWINGTR